MSNEIISTKNLDWANDVAPEKLSHKHKIIAMYLAIGKKHIDIAEVIGITQGRISILANSDIMKAEVKKLQKETYQKMEGMSDKLSVLVAPSIDILQDALFDPNTGTKLKVDIAEKILDRKLGRAKQQVEGTGNTIRDVIELLEKTGQTKTIIHPEKNIEVSITPLKPGEVTLDDIGQEVLDNMGDTRDGEKADEFGGTTRPAKEKQDSDGETDNGQERRKAATGNDKRPELERDAEGEKDS